MKFSREPMLAIFAIKRLEKKKLEEKKVISQNETLT